MTEEQARAALNVPRETIEHIHRFLELLKQENEVQNLVSRGSLDHVWERHVLDSAQLIRFAPQPASSWLDLGTGAGFPGLIVALLHCSKVTMVESRKLRAEFLQRAADLLGIANRTNIVRARVESFAGGPFDVISARAFAPLDKLFALAERFAAPQTRWILPKGRNAKSELEAATASWQGSFSLEPSVTDPESGIIIAEQVRRRARGKAAR